MRCDEKFELFWKDGQNKAASLRIDPPKLPKKRKAPSRIEECLGGNAAPEFDEEIVSYYRKIYYEAPDCITNAIIDRFDQQDFKTYIKLEKFLIRHQKVITSMQSTIIFYQYIVKILMAIDFKYTWKHFQNIIRRLTLFTIAEVLKNLKVRSHLMELIKQAKMISVMPATNSESERSFSILQLIKTYL